MNVIKKGVIFDGKARVAIIDVKDIVNYEIKTHDLSPLSSATLGRTMAVGAYVGNNLKDEDSAFSITIKGDGISGATVVAGNGKGEIRGYIENPHANLPLRADGHLDVGGGVGKGFITVIKDLGLKEPYVGRCELVSGEIAEDFAQYLYASEGINSAVALGVRMDATGCVSAGGIIVEALPGLTEEELFMIEDVMTNFNNVSEVLEKLSPKEIFDFYFAHLNAESYDEEEIIVKCNCSEEKIESTLRSLGKQECYDVIEELGQIEIVCHFCEKRYVYDKTGVDKLWEN